MKDSSVQCWGANDSGQLGVGILGSELLYSGKPLAVVGLSNVAKVSAGYDNVCAVLYDGTVQCWGYLTLGSYYDFYTTPRDVGLQGVVDVSSGLERVCVVFANGATSCWGDVTYGSGYGPYYSPPRPSTASLAPNEIATKSISAGYMHDCALKVDHTITCWGQAYQGQLGLGQYESSPGFFADNPGPGTVVGIDDAVAVSAGNNDTCAVRSDGSVWCWGAESGDSQSYNSAVPLKVPGAD